MGSGRKMLSRIPIQSPLWIVYIGQYLIIFIYICAWQDTAYNKILNEVPLCLERFARPGNTDVYKTWQEFIESFLTQVSNAIQLIVSRIQSKRVALDMSQLVLCCAWVKKKKDQCINSSMLFYCKKAKIVFYFQSSLYWKVLIYFDRVE